MKFVKKTRGFTLIELLVVIAIIAILAAILFPVFMAAKKQALRSKCLSNQKQLIMAFLRYADDHANFTCPTRNYKKADGGDDICWMQWLFPYTTRNPDIFFCPERPDPKTMSDQGERTIFDGSQFNSSWRVSIGMSCVCGDLWMGNGAPPVKISEFRSPTQTLIFADSSYRNYEDLPESQPPSPQGRTHGIYIIAPGKDHPDLCKGPGIKEAMDQRPGFTHDFFDPDRHNGDVVVAHLDGHVKIYTQKFVLSTHATEVNSPGYSIWDRR